MATIRCIGAGALLFLLVAAPALAAGQNAADVEQGRRLYGGMCVTCHGFDGAGGEAPMLNRPLSQDDETLRRIIGNGIPNRGMPRVRRLTDNEITQLVSYVRSLGRIVPVTSPGDAARGAEIYSRQGCGSCHIIKGEGGSLGPDLTSIGALRPLPHLKQAVLEPEAALSRNSMLIPGRSYSEYLPVLVVTQDGREVRGMRINEDTFTIQLRDGSNRFHSFRKSSLRRIEKENGKSLMPGYKNRLTAIEAEDVVAYLSSLRGDK